MEETDSPQHNHVRPALRLEEGDDVGAGETHDEGYNSLRCSMWVAEEGEHAPRSSGLEEVRDCLEVGQGYALNRIGQFLRIVGHLLEDVGYTCELRGHNMGEEDTTRATREEGEDSTFMQTSSSARRKSTGDEARVST